ncbi:MULTISPECIES: hypothetical protein [unclassified Streptomyces]|uniref:hypothetical protein n=1 Tax=unclassified Streptomyces TaxID=2593676 RepID=UPI0036E24D9F
MANAVTSSRPRARSTSSSTSVVPGKLASSPRGEDTYAITRDPELESHLADLQVRAAKESDPKESGPLLAECSRLRAIAAVAIALAHVHGRLAWFLAAATPLTPVLHRRALPDENSPTSGAVAPTPAQYTEAEDAVRRLQNALAGISTA